MGTPQILIGVNLWYAWSCIAIDHERQALRALETLMAEWDVPTARHDMAAEMFAAMVAVVASADAIDALHAEVAPLINRDSDPRRKGKRWGYMLQTFRIAYPAAETWHADFEWLFTSRGNAVHFQMESKVPVPHPSLPTNVAPENAVFSAEGATRAVNLLMTVFRSVLGGDTELKAAKDWGRKERNALIDFEKRRASSG